MNDASAEGGLLRDKHLLGVHAVCQSDGFLQADEVPRRSFEAPLMIPSRNPDANVEFLGSGAIEIDRSAQLGEARHERAVK